MKHLNKIDSKVIDVLKEQIKNEKAYNQKFIDARNIVKKRELERLTQYDKFKTEQEKNKKANDILIGYLTPKEK